MALDFPVRVVDPGEAERAVNVDPPAAVPRRVPLQGWARRHRGGLVLGTFVFAVLAFSRAWTRGALVLDGPGLSLYVRLALDHLGANHRVPYWLPDLWAGTPAWAAVPTLPVFLLAPLGSVLGADGAVKAAVLGLQIVGACGTFVLARSLWRNLPAAVLAGVLFALQPLVVATGALAGDAPAVAVMAVAPWLAWALTHGLRGDGAGYLVVSGFLAGFAVLVEPEYAVGLAVLAACLVAVEAGRVGTGRNPATPGQLAGRAGAVVALAVGVSAWWLFPHLALRRSFVRSVPSLIQGRRDVGLFFGRGGSLSGAVSYARQDLLPHLLHLGWVGLALTLLTVAVVARRDRDGTITAVLLAAALGLWLSAGGAALASSGPARDGEVMGFVVAGLAAGLLLGALLRPLPLGRLAPVAVVAVTALLVAAPYVSPFHVLSRLVPLLGDLRTPRFYTAVPLALALGAAYPVVAIAASAGERRPGGGSAASAAGLPGARAGARAGLPGALAGAVALAVAGAFLVDVWPARSYYEVRPPATAGAYRRVVANLDQAQGDVRLAPGAVLPTADKALLDAGRPLALGWPPAAAGSQVWRLTAEPLLAPDGYRQRALGLSAAAYQVVERVNDRGTGRETVSAIDVAANPRALPMVRAYTHTVAVTGRDLTPELAVGLASRNVGVFTRTAGARSAALAATTVVDVRSPTPCADDSGARLDPGLASELGVACGLHSWLDTLVDGVDLVSVDSGVGAVFRSTTDRLQGVSVYLDRPPDRAELSLHEVLPGAAALGPELARGKAVGTDENGLTAFTFDAIAGSAGKDYAFVLTCPGCAPNAVPRLIAGHTGAGKGDLVVAGALRTDRAAAFAPVYEPVAGDPPSTTKVTPARRGPGRWRVRASGTQPALVVVAEAWFPGWTARVDGRRASLVEADGGFLGVPVDAGDHTVTLEYHRPPASTAGWLVTGATVLAVAGLAVRRRRAARPARPARPAPPARRARPPRPGAGAGVPAPAPDPGPAPLLDARVRPAREEPDWDEAVQPPDQPPRPGPTPPRAPTGETGEGAPAPPPEHPPEPPPRRAPGTARWPPEPG